MIDETLLSKAVEVWGDFQVNLAIEECAEFIVEAEHKIRGRDNHVIEEIADVLIMMRQMQIMFGYSEVESVINDKMNRLKLRLDSATDG